jgi:hypothetical protein
MMTDSRRQARGSDWIDIIWASYENALVNAELYAALNLFAEAEEELGDQSRANAYRSFAGRLKASFNRKTSDGGFWDETNQWYVYWREKDGSIHGNNLVTPVNFAAIAYGICDDPTRQKAILDRVEEQTTKENLFYWPLNILPYAPGEGDDKNYPFPSYENGDIFLSWGELATRAYAKDHPDLALKYVKNVLNRYAEDGLSFQRYLRATQKGAGDDILAGNCMPIVGLFRNIYGIQPRPDRLFLDPHLPAELSGTRLEYTLRGEPYTIELSEQDTQVHCAKGSLRARHPFAVSADGSSITYFHDAVSPASISFMPPQGSSVEVDVTNWPDDLNAARDWNESAARGTPINHQVKGLSPHSHWSLLVNGHVERTLNDDESGDVNFRWETPRAGGTAIARD